MRFFQASDVVAIHDSVIQPNELQGLACSKSIDAIIARIDNRIAFGFISDAYELAACYACCIGVGHAFNDANKRTAFVTMDLSLRLNGIILEYETEVVGQLIVKAARGLVDEFELANWLREQHSNSV